MARSTPQTKDLLDLVDQLDYTSNDPFNNMTEGFRWLIEASWDDEQLLNLVEKTLVGAINVTSSSIETNQLKSVITQQ